MLVLFDPSTREYNCSQYAWIRRRLHSTIEFRSLPVVFFSFHVRILETIMCRHRSQGCREYMY